MVLHKKGSSIAYYSTNVSVSLKKFVVKDLGCFSVLLIIYILIIYTFPNLFVDFLNLEKADSMVTPKHIKPEWYFMPFYGILKTIPHKAGGILCMGLSIAIFLLIPFIYRIKKIIKNKILLFNTQFNLNKLLKYQNKSNLLKEQILFLNNCQLKGLLLFTKTPSLYIRRIYFIIFLSLLVSLGFFNDLPLGPYYIISYFLIIILIV